MNATVSDSVSEIEEFVHYLNNIYDHNLRRARVYSINKTCMYMQGSTVKFTRLWDDVIKKYAFYTLIDNDPAKRAYLLLFPDDTQTGHRKDTMHLCYSDGRPVCNWQVCL